MWKNSLKNVESDNNKILYETLLDFFYSEIYCLNKLLTTNAVRIKYVAKNQNVFHVLVGRFSFFLQATQALRVSTGIALLFLDYGTRRVSVIIVTPRPLFTPGERSGTHCTAGWMGLRAGLDRCGKISLSTRIRSQDRPARNQSLYRPTVLLAQFGMNS